MDSHPPAPPPLRMLQSRARAPDRLAQAPAPAVPQAWWQRWLPWAVSRPH